MEAASMHNLDYRFKGRGNVFARGALGLGLATLVAAAASYFVFPDERALLHFKFSYLTAWLYCLSISLGALFFTMIQHITHARWSVVVRRLAEGLMINVDILAFLFIPIFFWLPEMYHWADAEHVAHDALLQSKAPYLNPQFFIIRIAIYFIVWNVLARMLYNRSVRQDATGDPHLTVAMRKISAPGLLLFAITITFAAFDIIMSLDPHWYSTIFGVYFFGGSVLILLAVLAIVCNLLSSAGVVGNSITVEHMHDIGKLLFAFVVFWTYIAFSQFLLIWMANIPEETIWFIHRWEAPGWHKMSMLLVIGHFVIPFIFLLPRTIKRTRVTLTIGALWLMIMHYVDIYWLVMPVFEHASLPLSPMDPLLAIAFVGLFFFVYFARLQRQPVIPVRDPYLADSLAFENF